MLLIGMILADIPLRGALTDGGAWIVTLLRLIVFPGAAIGIFCLLPAARDVGRIAVTMLCLPAGLNAVVFARRFGGDAEAGAKCTLLSNLLGFLTIPLFFSLAAALLG